MRIHREGYSTLILTLILGVAINTPIWLISGSFIVNILASILYFITFLFIARFFRYPKRIREIDLKHIISPADGKVIVIREEEELEYFKDMRLRVSVFMSGFNVHANWIPVSGTVQYSRYHPGRNLLAVHPKSSILNERTSVVIRNEKGDELLVKQIAGIFARRVVSYPEGGDRIEQGDELGFIKFGSRIDLFLPLDTKVLVNIDDKVKGNISEIASW